MPNSKPLVNEMESFIGKCFFVSLIIGCWIHEFWTVSAGIMVSGELYLLHRTIKSRFKVEVRETKKGKSNAR